MNLDKIFVVGGQNSTQPFSTEIWSFDDDDNTWNMKIADPTLKNYERYPELFVVPSDFCSKTQ